MSELLHEKIYSDLLNKIKTRRFEEGIALPTELEMVSIYGVSKAPIRQALAKLEQEGFIVRRAGKGTFVARRSQWPYNTMSGNAQELNQKGKYCHCVTISIKQEKLNKTIAEIMGLPVGTKAVSVERVRYYKDEPIHYLHHYVVNLDKKIIEIEGNFSSLLAIYEKNNIEISMAKDVLEAVGAPKDVAKWLKIEPGHPVLLNNRTTFREENQILEFVFFYSKTKDWKYRVDYFNKV